MLLLKLLLLLPFLTRPQTLASYVDHKRVLLVFASSATDEQWKQQQAILQAHPAELTDRDLVVLPAIGAEADPLRKQYKVQPAQFTVILIGKDGDEKLRQHTPITIAKLSEIIDAMPMRQDEMRGKK